MWQPMFIAKDEQDFIVINVEDMIENGKLYCTKNVSDTFQLHLH